MTPVLHCSRNLPSETFGTAPQLDSCVDPHFYPAPTAPPTRDHLPFFYLLASLSPLHMVILENTLF